MEDSFTVSCIGLGWVGFGNSVDGLGWVGSLKMDPQTTLTCRQTENSQQDDAWTKAMTPGNSTVHSHAC